MIDKMTLTELQLLIRDSLYTSLPGFYWVTGEISEIRDNQSGHCYLELIEKSQDEVNVRARIKSIIWNNRLRFIRPSFENITGEWLKSGMKILAQVKVEYHELYGLSLIINDIDPAFTIGEMALKRLQIIRQLEKEGVITMNKELDFPLVPQRIAVISSSGAAGYTDFMKHLTLNIYGYKFHTTLFEAVMQGADTEKSITGALDMISERLDLFDVVVIVRGGGSVSDLSWFDSYAIAYHITQFPLPVVTGIGHEKDLSVTDIVAYRSEKTPTAVADFLTGCFLSADESITVLSNRITEAASLLISFYNEKINRSGLRLVPAARILISEGKEKLSTLILNLLSYGKDFISYQASLLASGKADIKAAARSSLSEKKAALSGFMASVNHLDPVNVLKRGYTITSSGGKIIRSYREVTGSDILETRFSDGRVTSVVTERREKDKK